MRTFKKAASIMLTAAMATTAFGVTAAVADEAPEHIKVMLWDRGDAPTNGTIEDNKMSQWIQEQVLEELNIEVEFVSVPRSTSDDVLNVMLAGGEAPDIVFTYDQSIFYNYATLGGLADLTEAVENYGDNITEYMGNFQNMANIDGVQLGILKRRGAEWPRHTAYIRQDWLDAMEMELPTNKEELFEYLYAVKEQNPGNIDNVIPWGMSGRQDTEKTYLNFVGSYVTLEDDRDAYIYNEAYIAVAPGAIDGIKKLNELYNDGIISQDFATDTTEDNYKAQVTAGNVGFVLDDNTRIFDYLPTLNAQEGGTTFVPVAAFNLEGSDEIRNPFEPEYGMYIMVPGVSQDKADACVKYINWLSDPAVAENVAFSPEHEVDENGVPIAIDGDTLKADGYKGTLDDYCIANGHFAYTDDPEAIVASWTNVNTWESEEWFANLYEVTQVGKFRYPTYSAIVEAEAENGATIKSSMIEYVYRLVSCNPDEFDSLQESLYSDMLNSGLQDILDQRAEYYDTVVAAE